MINVGANVLTFAVPVGLENVPRAATLPWKGRVGARGGGVNRERVPWGHPTPPALRRATLPLQGRVTVLHGPDV